jgi:hypothetical protein
MKYNLNKRITRLKYIQSNPLLLAKSKAFFDLIKFIAADKKAAAVSYKTLYGFYGNDLSEIKDFVISRYVYSSEHYIMPRDGDLGICKRYKLIKEFDLPIEETKTVKNFRKRLLGKIDAYQLVNKKRTPEEKKARELNSQVRDINHFDNLSIEQLENFKYLLNSADQFTYKEKEVKIQNPSDKNRRIYSTITSVKESNHQYIKTLDGNGVAEIDIRNSQPTFLLLLNKDLVKKYANNLSKPFIKYQSDFDKVKNMESYKLANQQDDIYDFLAEKLEVGRSKVKIAFCNLLFAKNKYEIANRNKKIAKDIEEILPFVTKVKTICRNIEKEFKTKSYLSNLLVTIESNFVMGHMVGSCRKLGAPVLRKHDAIFVNNLDLTKVYNKISDDLTKGIQLKVTDKNGFEVNFYKAKEQQVTSVRYSSPSYRRPVPIASVSRIEELCKQKEMQ